MHSSVGHSQRLENHLAQEIVPSHAREIGNKVAQQCEPKVAVCWLIRFIKRLEMAGESKGRNTNGLNELKLCQPLEDLWGGIIAISPKTNARAAPRMRE